MMWRLSSRADPVAVAIADRHYNRQKPGTPQFMPPGSCIVFTADSGAVWGTSWPLAEYTKHAWAGAWVNSIFRNEGDEGATEMIQQAVAATRWFYGEPPQLGFITMIDHRKVKPTMVRGLPTWGMTYRRAGWHYAGLTQGGLLVYQLMPVDMPEPEPPIDAQPELFETERIER